ncbi:MAG: hypothetical protein HKN81_12405 [Gammaproteobacteria bacterium]|nr:hypothetical protein [Gammaproteobacteria bacterium]NND37924.1 hypothetical protein [Gammaproteobacteria bacterium]
MNEKHSPTHVWKYRAAIAGSVVVTGGLFYLGWLLLPEDYFLPVLIPLAVLGGFALDRYVARKKSARDDE